MQQDIFFRNTVHAGNKVENVLNTIPAEQFELSTHKM